MTGRKVRSYGEFDCTPKLGYLSALWNHHIAINAVANGAVTLTPLGG